MRLVNSLRSARRRSASRPASSGHLLRRSVLGGEGRVVRGRGESRVQLTCTLPQDAYQAREEGVLSTPLRLDVLLALKAPRGHQAVFQIAAEVVENVGPSVTLVLHKALQEAEGGRVAVRPLVFDGPGQRRRFLEASLLGEVASDLQVRIRPFLEAAVCLQDEPLAEYHGAVGLLHLGAPHAQFGDRFLPDKLTEDVRAREADPALSNAHLPTFPIVSTT